MTDEETPRRCPLNVYDGVSESSTPAPVVLLPDAENQPTAPPPPEPDVASSESVSIIPSLAVRNNVVVVGQAASDSKIPHRVPTSSSNPTLQNTDSQAATETAQESPKKTSSTAAATDRVTSPKRVKSLSELVAETPESLLNDLAYEYQCYRELAYWAKREEDEIVARVSGGCMTAEYVEKLYDDMCPESVCYRLMQEVIEEEEEEQVSSSKDETVIVEDVKEEHPVSYSEPHGFSGATGGRGGGGGGAGSSSLADVGSGVFDECPGVVGIRIDPASSASSFHSSNIGSVSTANSSFGSFIRSVSSRSSGSRPPSIGFSRRHPHFSMSVDSGSKVKNSSSSSSTASTPPNNQQQHPQSSGSHPRHPIRSSSLEHIKFSHLKQKMGSFVHALAAKGSSHHHHHHHHPHPHQYHSSQLLKHQRSSSPRDNTDAVTDEDDMELEFARVRHHSGPADVESELVYDSKRDVWITAEERAANKRRCLTRTRSEVSLDVPFFCRPASSRRCVDDPYAGLAGKNR
ncbi:unnamed protein product [Notodromas monacha]|uniref:Uncharacterized protein n=1 Tax=Notodromas monacha TaxID=399045 RepID=A0A7R9C0D1_9CRUS|nr:unnamed protein product [Notodromas monacha]CAG0923444.1 unnamed protein product [Notodromas monacha]